MRTQPQEVIAKLEADNSRLAKEAVIQSAMEEGLDEFFEGVTMALDPLVTFGVKQVPEKEENEVLSPQGLNWPTFKELTRKLIDRQLTGHNARDAIILCKDLLLSLPLVKGTMQNVQNLSHPRMIETHAFTPLFLEGNRFS